MSRLTLLLSLHDVTPRHLPRLARAEALFQGLGVTRVTYLVVPRFHGEWAIDRDDEFAAWCRAPRPFAVRWCLHGFNHQEGHLGRTRRWGPHDWLRRRVLTAGEAEFLALTEVEARRRIDRGREMFSACLGVGPTGFVAPAWLFNRALLPTLRTLGFTWTEDHRRIYRVQNNQTIDAPVIRWATRTIARRYGSALLSPGLLRMWSGRPVIRIAVHPFDLDDRPLLDGIRRVIASAMDHRILGEYEELLVPVD